MDCYGWYVQCVFYKINELPVSLLWCFVRFQVRKFVVTYFGQVWKDGQTILFFLSFIDFSIFLLFLISSFVHSFIRRLHLSQSDTMQSNEVDISSLSLEDKLIKRDLFGGAIKLSIPPKWRDVSQVRQIPDHQEVYQDCTITSSNSNNSDYDSLLEGTGGCVIVEILERQNNISDVDAVSFFFNDLADANKGETEETIVDGSALSSSSSSSERSLHYSKVWNVGRSNSSLSEEKVDDGKNNLMPNLNTRVVACSGIGHQSVGPLRNKDKLEEGKASEVVIELCVIRLKAVQTDLLISLSMPIFSKGIQKDKKVGNRKRHSDVFLSVLESFEVIDWTLFC